jgi:glycosyltransferase involved in cell wall biosynthesis
MRVLYVSKAMTSAAYRDKLQRMATQVELRAVAPWRWGATPADAVDSNQPWMQLVRAVFDGHNHFHLYRRPWQLFAGAQPDLVHIDEEPYSAVTAQLARHCARRKLPFVFFAWQNIDKRIPPPFDAVRSYVFRHARGGIAGTEEAARVLRAWGWTGPLGVIPQMGVDADRFRPDAEARQAVRESLNVSAADFVVGYGGRLLREKGVHVLVAAMRALPEARLVLLGSGPERDALEQAAHDAGIADRAILKGNVHSRDMARWLPAFDVLVLPSLTLPGWKEQFGRILIEAMACGIPVVGSSSGEIPRVIGDAGIVVPEGDSGALADALRSLLNSSILRAQLGERGRARVLEHYTNQKIASETVRFYQHVLIGAHSS